MDDAVAVNVLVHLPVFEQVVAAQRSAAFAPVARADVGAQGKIVVALEAEDEELVEGRLAEGAAGAQLLRGFVIVSFDLGKPMPDERAGEFFEGRLGLRPEARGLGCGCGVDGEAALGHAPNGAGDLRLLLELVARSEHLRREDGAGCRGAVPGRRCGSCDAKLRRLRPRRSGRPYEARSKAAISWRMLKLASTGAGPVKPLRMAQFSLRRSVARFQRYLALCSKGPENCAKMRRFCASQRNMESKLMASRCRL